MFQNYFPATNDIDGHNIGQFCSVEICNWTSNGVRHCEIHQRKKKRSSVPKF